MRAGLVALPITALLVFVAGPARGAEGDADLMQARAALVRNIGLCRPLVGKTVTPAQASEATRHAEESLAHARAVVAADPGRAEGHHHIGMTLCLGYYPRETAGDAAEAGKVGARAEPRLIVVRGSRSGKEDGLAAFRTAVRLAPNNTDYPLNYAEALQVCEEAQQSVEILDGLWKRRRELTRARQARAARLLGQAMRDLGRTAEEARWLREALTRDPDDAASARRLREVARLTSKGIAWHDYEIGSALLAHGQQPALIVFSTSACPWCVRLDKDVLSHASVIGESRRFVCIKVDGDRRRDLASRYQVRGFPTTIFLDPAGKPVHRVIGYRPVGQYLAEMRQAAEGR